MSRLGSFEVNKFSGYFDGCNIAKADKAQIYGRGDLTSSQADRIALKNAFDNKLGDIPSILELVPAPSVKLGPIPAPTAPIGVPACRPCANEQQSMQNMLSTVHDIVKQNSMTIIVVMLLIILFRR